MCKVFSSGVKTYHVAKTFYTLVKGPCFFSQTPFSKMIRLSSIIVDMNLRLYSHGFGDLRHSFAAMLILWTVFPLCSLAVQALPGVYF